MFKMFTFAKVRTILKFLRKLVKIHNRSKILSKSKNRPQLLKRTLASKISLSPPRMLHMAIRHLIKTLGELIVRSEATIIPSTTRSKLNLSLTFPSPRIIILKSRSRLLHLTRRSSRLPTMSQLTPRCVATHRSATTREQSPSRRRSCCLSAS